MMMDKTRNAAFMLATAQVATAIHMKPDEGSQPTVQIFTLGNGVTVCGVEALTALRDAVHFALNGPQPQRRA
jgi:hypothetical protein